jgi:hypothetical protein
MELDLPTTVFEKLKLLTPVETIPAVTVKLWLTGAAAVQSAFPAWVA